MANVIDATKMIPSFVPCQLEAEPSSNLLATKSITIETSMEIPTPKPFVLPSCYWIVTTGEPGLKGLD